MIRVPVETEKNNDPLEPAMQFLIEFEKITNGKEGSWSFWMVFANISCLIEYGSLSDYIYI